MVQGFGNTSPVQVAYGVTNNNLRPEISDECPKFTRLLIERCWNKNPRRGPARPEFEEIVKVLEMFDGTQQENIKMFRQCVS